MQNRGPHQVRDNDLGGNNLARGSSRNALGLGGSIIDDRDVRLLSGNPRRSLADATSDGSSSSFAAATVGTRAGGQDLVERAIKVGSHY